MTDKKLDARDYKWKAFDGRTPFAMLTLIANRPSIGEVFFDEDTFDMMDYSYNGESFSFYGSGDINEYAAIELSDGTILFCVVSGMAFTDTFHSAEDIRMKYYFLTKLPVKPDSNKKKTK